jgi:hypothetical protein
VGPDAMTRQASLIAIGAFNMSALGTDRKWKIR